MTLIRELIDIPDRVQRGDFVLRLTEGVNDPAETLRNYVVTPELARCCDAALGIIRGNPAGRGSSVTSAARGFQSGRIVQ